MEHVVTFVCIYKCSCKVFCYSYTYDMIFMTILKSNINYIQPQGQPPTPQWKILGAHLSLPDRHLLGGFLEWCPSFWITLVLNSNRTTTFTSEHLMLASFCMPLETATFLFRPVLSDHKYVCLSPIIHSATIDSAIGLYQPLYWFLLDVWCLYWSESVEFFKSAD